MNYFAHLVLAKPTVDSVIGNLLGDFARGVDISTLSPAIRSGLLNHRAVDQFTDAHDLVKTMKLTFSPQRRRFAGIALDIYFDHLLLTHWSVFENRNLDQLIDDCYQRIIEGTEYMPSAHMQKVCLRIVEQDWFRSYRDLEHIAQALNRVAARIRFTHSFDHAIEDLLANHELIERGFVEFYPQLQQYVARSGNHIKKPSTE